MIEDIGDLNGYFGYEDHDFKGLTVEYGKTYSGRSYEVNELKGLNFTELYKKGYTNIIVKNSELWEFSKFPINVISNETLKLPNSIKVDVPANLIFRKNSEVKYAAINGFLFSVNNYSGEVKNGLIY